MCKIEEKENCDSINTFLPFQMTRSDVQFNKRNRETERKRIRHVFLCGKKRKRASEREREIASPKIREQNVFVSTSFSSLHLFPSFSPSLLKKKKLFYLFNRTSFDCNKNIFAIIHKLIESRQKR